MNKKPKGISNQIQPVFGRNFPGRVFPFSYNFMNLHSFITECCFYIIIRGFTKDYYIGLLDDFVSHKNHSKTKYEKKY